jgi:hypothetical protein
MFDRLVCMNGGNPREDLIDHKDPELTMRLKHSPEWEGLSHNHLEGRTAAFFCYGDGGADELDATGRPRHLRHPEYFDPAKEPFAAMRDAFAPLVWQCRYRGIEVPDDLWRYEEFGRGKKYSDNQAEDMVALTGLWKSLDDWTDHFTVFVRRKGKVEPGRYRAYSYRPPGRGRAVRQVRPPARAVGGGPSLCATSAPPSPGPPSRPADTASLAPSGEKASPWAPPSQRALPRRRRPASRSDRQGLAN